MSFCYRCPRVPPDGIFYLCGACCAKVYCSPACADADVDHAHECALIGDGRLVSAMRRRRDYRKLKDRARREITKKLAMFLHMDYIYARYHYKGDAPWDSGDLEVPYGVQKIYRQLAEEYADFGLGDLTKKIRDARPDVAGKLLDIFIEIIAFVL